MTKHGKPGTLKAFANRFSEAEVTTQAAALTFYTTLALAPSLLLVLTLLGALAPDSQERVIDQMVQMGGEDIEPFVRTLIASASDQPNLRRAAGWISFLLLLVSASALFTQLQASMNRLWDACDPDLSGLWATIRHRLVSIGLLLLLVAISIAAMFLEAVLSHLPGPPWLWFAASAIVGLALYAGLFAALYRYLPDRRIPWSTAFRGGAITAVLFVLGRAGIGLYLSYSSAAGAFGAAGSVIIWLLWSYYIGIVFLASAALLYVLAKRRGWAWFDDDAADPVRDGEPIPG